MNPSGSFYFYQENGMSLRVRTESSRFWRPDRSQAVGHMVVKAGNDPATSRLSSECSNQLSYLTQNGGGGGTRTHVGTCPSNLQSDAIAAMRHPRNGASRGNRTLISALEEPHSTVELLTHKWWSLGESNPYLLGANELCCRYY